MVLAWHSNEDVLVLHAWVVGVMVRDEAQVIMDLDMHLVLLCTSMFVVGFLKRFDNDGDYVSRFGVFL